jgi:hypothetical protein
MEKSGVTIRSSRPLPACGTDVAAELTAVRWLPLGASDEWDAELRSDPFLYPQLKRIRAALGLSGAALRPAAG